MAQSAVIQAEGLTMRYPDSGCVLEDIGFEVEKNQFVSILGPSGCGKSVLLHLLCGIEQPTAGTITYNGQAFKQGVPPKYRRHIGYVFQDSNLLAWRTVEQNLLYPLEILKMTKTVDTKQRVREMLELVGLSKFGGSYPHELSGGMKQRVAFVRALMHDPDIMLLDQPFGALDAITRKMLNYSLLNLWRKTQKAMVMVTNNVEEAILLSSKVIFMSKNPGKITKTIPVDIPDEARGEQIAKYPGYAAIKQELDEMVRALDIKTGKAIISAEAV